MAETIFSLPDKRQLAEMLGEEGCAALLAEAAEVVAGKVRLFGGEVVPLQLCAPQPLQHWSVYENRGIGPDGQDIKFTWEAGRFGWAFTLGRAYYLSGNEVYAEAFWRYTRQFLAGNPPYLGPHWVSGQEVALRLMALAFAGQVFNSSIHTSEENRFTLARAIDAHAARIPLTLAYARAQNNNHLLTEAVGLYTAACALPTHPQAGYWRKMGWHWLNRALQTQISPEGVYIQHSSNYQRLMLQAALWVHSLGHLQDEPAQISFWPRETLNRLAVATRWLYALLDENSGRLPNLGANDGAFILPLTICPYDDYRPTLQAAAVAFLDRRLFAAGIWDDMGSWLGLDMEGIPCHSAEQSDANPIEVESQPVACVIRNRRQQAWAYLRAARFTSRPSHADQLHVDLWWRGLNLAQDAGSYLYNAPPPWENALVEAAVHNTVTVDEQDQMRRVGRFLYLDWAQANLLSLESDSDRGCVVAEHIGYRHLGVIHRRSVEVQREGMWMMEDQLLPVALSSCAFSTKLLRANRSDREDEHQARLQWLLPDWNWQLEEVKGQPWRCELQLQSPFGVISLTITFAHSVGSAAESSVDRLPCVQLVRGGELLYGAGGISPVWGWVSPTYGVKVPALSLAVIGSGRLPLVFRTKWRLPELVKP